MGTRRRVTPGRFPPRRNGDDNEPGLADEGLPPDHRRDSLSAARPPEAPAELIWQDLDLAPRYPVLRKFLDFWESSLDGKLHSVRVASATLIKPAEFRHASLMRLH